MFEILPKRFATALASLDKDKLNEIRLRVGLPTSINYDGWSYLGESGISNSENSLIPLYEELQDIVFKACECSVYAHNEELINGFITYKGGRIGLSGDVVTEGEKIVTIKNFSSLVIRFIHAKVGCSLPALKYLLDNGLLNTLVISPPGCGKTTFIRDLTLQLSQIGIEPNILVVDERGEIAAVESGKATLFVGANVDVLSKASKYWGLSCGVRSLAPSVVVFDEIMTENDCKAILSATGCGVKLIATTHSKDIKSLQTKAFYPILKGVFQRIVVLSNRNGIGTIEGVFSLDGKSICGGES